jgi:hypothetical protein
MNKTLMLVICDFLLLSMLALARFDPPEAPPKTTLDATASSATAEAELISLLEESLESELESRSSLSQDLIQTKQNLDQKARDLAAREAALTATQKSLEQTATEVDRLTEANASIASERAKLANQEAKADADRKALAEKFESTRTELENAQSERLELALTLGQLKQESSVSKERLSQAEQALIERKVVLSQREAELKAAQEEAQRLNQERKALNQQLQIAQAERNLLEQNLTQEQQEKAQALAHAIQLTENVGELGAGMTQLGQGVAELSASSAEIIKEMDASRPLTMSQIFTQFQNNRATLHFTSREKPRNSSPITRRYESKSILITDQSSTYLVTHTKDTPFALSKSLGSVLDVALKVSLADRTFPINQIAFLKADPRLIYIHLPDELVDASGLQSYALALQPQRWEEAVLIKNDESNFGRTGFRRLTMSERFLKMNRPTLGELFADFACSRGDFAFTKNNQFIGLLIDSQHTLVIDRFLACETSSIGPNFNKDENSATIRRLKDRVRELPSEVQ